MSNILSGVVVTRVYKMSGTSKHGTQYSLCRLEYLTPARGFSSEKTVINAVGFDLREITASESAFQHLAEIPFLTHVDLELTADPRDPTKNQVSGWAPHGSK